MKLYIKIILFVVLIALFTGSLAVILVNHLMEKALEDEMKKRCIDITQAISETITENVINNEVLPTREILQKIVQRSNDIEFAYVVGFDGNLFTHSFEKGFPKNLVNEKHEIVAKDSPKLHRYLMEKKSILTVGYPLIDDMLAHIHIGMSESNVHYQIKVLRNRIMFFTLIVIFFGILIATFFSFRITVPIKQLADSMQAYGQGKKKEDLEFHGGGREVKELTQSFKQMIKERKQADNRIIHLNHILRSLRDINQLITKEKNRDVLLQESCRIITKDKGYSNVWLVLFDEEYKIDFITESGIGENIQLLIKNLKKDKLSYCIKNAINQKEILLIDNPEFECSDCPLSGKYEGRGAIAVRLEHNKKVYGVLCVRIEKEYLADEEMLDLFKEITGDISFAIYRLELEKAHDQAEEQIQQQNVFLNKVLESLSHPFYVVDTHDYTISLANSASGFRSSLKNATCHSITHKSEKPCQSKEHPCPLEIVKKTKKPTMVEHIHLDKDGNARNVEVHGYPLFDNKGNVIQMIEYCLDITERKQAEEQIKKDLEEKKVLLQELYHRTKNNMQVVSSMLKIQLKNIENRDLTGSTDIEYTHDSFNEIIYKIKAMSLVHEKLYQAKDLSHINLKEYIEDLVRYLMRGYNTRTENVILKLELDDVFVLIDSAIPLGLVLNEIISNVFKHAFPHTKNDELFIKLYKEENETINIYLNDNGIGIPNDFDLRNVNTMGLQTVFSLTEHQLMGEVKYDTKKGLKWHISFKDNMHKERV
ncbi:MAG: PAS domain-containing protein [Candidatus Cloacimonetes bacterium]|nr:PAS domain-containing protein [Candidatus Cloacimonadota bacterium]